MGENALHLRCPEPVRRGLAADVMERAPDPVAIGLLGAGGVVIRAEPRAHLVHAREAGMPATCRLSILLTFHHLAHNIAIRGNQQGKTQYMEQQAG